MTATIEAGTTLEDLVVIFPGAVSILLQRNLPCLVCGEPIWGTLGELARSHGWDDGAIAALVEDLNGAYEEASK